MKSIYLSYILYLNSEKLYSKLRALSPYKSIYSICILTYEIQYNLLSYSDTVQVIGKRFVVDGRMYRGSCHVLLRPEH